MGIDQYRERIRASAGLHAFISLTSEEGEGTVVGVKDLVDVAGVPTTGGGAILPAEPATGDAPVIRIMRAQGCVVVGKTNLHEWAFGITSSNPHHGDVVNPLAPDRVAGGSSGGSAVAVAARLCDWAVGSDTGGSIRVPAAFCGVVGIKPTYGRIPLDGVIPLSPALDTLGPMAAGVAAAAAALEQMTGERGLVPAGGAARRSDLNLAAPRGWIRDLDLEVAAGWSAVGAGLPEIAFGERGPLFETGNVILFHEAARFHRRWIEQFPERYGADVLALLRQGLEIDEAAHRRALEDRERLAEEADAALRDLDALVLPATACVPPLRRQTDVREPVTRFTRPFNTTGQPVVAMPLPVSGLPVGIQVVGRRGDERRLIAVAAALETWLNAGGSGAASGFAPQ